MCLHKRAKLKAYPTLWKLTCRCGKELYIERNTVHPPADLWTKPGEPKRYASRVYTPHNRMSAEKIAAIVELQGRMKGQEAAKLMGVNYSTISKYWLEARNNG